MFAHALVLLCGCAYAVNGVPHVPKYLQTWNEYQTWARTVEKNILSISSGGEVPLNDPRRHHAVIFNVINEDAKELGTRLGATYDGVYKENIVSAPLVALSRPEMVVCAASVLLDAVADNTKNVSDYLNMCIGSTDDCNARIQELVEVDKEAHRQTQLALTAGNAAKILNEQAELFNYAAEHYAALPFVLNGENDLKDGVVSLSEVYNTVTYKQRLC